MNNLLELLFVIWGRSHIWWDSVQEYSEWARQHRLLLSGDHPARVVIICLVQVFWRQLPPRRPISIIGVALNFC
jgi:hypothetical protein